MKYLGKELPKRPSPMVVPPGCRIGNIQPAMNMGSTLISEYILLDRRPHAGFKGIVVLADRKIEEWT